MDAHRCSEGFQLRVRNLEPIETTGELIGMRSWRFIKNGVIVGSPILRGHMMRILSSAAEFGKAREWFSHVFLEVANLIYGGNVLRPEDEGSRRLSDNP